MIETCPTATHLQRVVMRRSNRKGSAPAPSSLITIQAVDQPNQLPRHAVALHSSFPSQCARRIVTSSNFRRQREATQRRDQTSIAVTPGKPNHKHSRPPTRSFARSQPSFQEATNHLILS